MRPCHIAPRVARIWLAPAEAREKPARSPPRFASPCTARVPGLAGEKLQIQPLASLGGLIGTVHSLLDERGRPEQPWEVLRQGLSELLGRHLSGDRERDLEVAVAFQHPFRPDEREPNDVPVAV